MSDVAERVKKIVVEHLGVDADKVVDNANFIDDLGADSLDTVELVMAFEEEFGVEIPDDQAETIVTVGDAVKFLEKAVGGQVTALAGSSRSARAEKGRRKSGPCRVWGALRRRRSRFGGAALSRRADGRWELGERE